MKSGLKSLLRRLQPGWIQAIRGRLAYLDLLESNLYVGLPNATKQLLVRRASEVLGYSTFIETGTYRGDMALHAGKLFDTVHTVELEPRLANEATARFRDIPNVTVHQGDSGSVLRRLLPSIRANCLFWLDAHYSGGVTARGDSDTAVLAELQAIAEHPVRPHAILIDDARVFGADPGYPTLETIMAALHRIDPTYRIGVSADAIWATPVPILEFEWRETSSGVVEIGAMDASRGSQQAANERA